MPGRNAFVDHTLRSIMVDHSICTLGDVKPCQIQDLDDLIVKCSGDRILRTLYKIPTAKDFFTNCSTVNCVKVNVVEKINDITVQVFIFNICTFSKSNYCTFMYNETLILKTHHLNILAKFNSYELSILLLVTSKLQVTLTPAKSKSLIFNKNMLRFLSYSYVFISQMS